MQKKPTIALFTTSEGHYSLYESAKQALEADYNVVTFYKREPFFDIYVLFYQFFPGGYKLPFILTKGKSVVRMMQSICLSRYEKQIKNFFSIHQIDLAISSFVGFNSSIEQSVAATNTPFLNIVSDPRTLHPFLLSAAANMNYVFDREALELSNTIDPTIPAKPVGWFVRSQFEEKYDLEKVRQQLKLDPKTLMFLLSAGSEGTNFITTILPAMIGSSRSLQLVIACGSNKNLYKSMKFLQKMLRKTKSKVSITPIGFTQNLHQYMQAADLIIGKAGPNTVFESVATRTPFFAITHISGQEDGNLDVIREYKLGYVEENPFKAAKLLQKILANPKVLEQFQPSIEKMAIYNEHAKKHLLTDVKSLLADSLPQS
jgi:UDP-N-acetylglucosamine:LPS N-acetylglucosamine transferase